MFGLEGGLLKYISRIFKYLREIRGKYTPIATKLCQPMLLQGQILNFPSPTRTPFYVEAFPPLYSSNVPSSTLQIEGGGLLGVGVGQAALSCD